MDAIIEIVTKDDFSGANRKPSVEYARALVAKERLAKIYNLDRSGR